MTNVFETKLQGLPATLALRNADVEWRLADALRRSSESAAIAVGSGGSAISAAFLAACRQAISPRTTTLASPMEFVLGSDDVSASQVWLFSGRGDNADVIACLEAAASRHIDDLQLVTSNPAGLAVERARTLGGCTVHIAPVADPKDGFLSTHSLAAAMSATLGATDLVVGTDSSQQSFSEIFARNLAPQHIAKLRNSFRRMTAESTLVVLSDPVLAPMAIALETSIWECAFCTVQRTDMRNFAHGRHTLLAKRPEAVHVVGLTTLASEDVWTELVASLPESTAISRFDYGAGSRRDVAASVIEALAIIWALGDVFGVDPGKPGIGAFAKDVYAGSSLATLAGTLSPSVRHKVRAIRRTGPSQLKLSDLVAAQKTAVQRLSLATFDAVILDYDGTIVETKDRYQPPRPALVAQLARLLQAGVTVGIATGRGGSVGEDLRAVLPSSLHDRVVVGYYNGGYVKGLNVDISQDRPEPSPIIRKMIDWLTESGDYPPGTRDSGPQLSITMADVKDPQRLERRILEFPGHVGGQIRIARSKHSLDIGVATNTKLNVRHEIAARLGTAQIEALCLGDSGHAGGNDFELLGDGHGVSVDSVCHRSDGCWNLFGDTLKGPNAVLRILDAIKLNTNGTFQLAVERLTD